MKLCGWPYEGRVISEQLHKQMLKIVEIICDPMIVGSRTWPQLQPYIAAELGTATGQVRTIKRMMEELQILRRGALNASTIPSEEALTKSGKTLVELMETEELMISQGAYENRDSISSIQDIYKLYYQKALANYTINLDGHIIHPLKVTLRAIKKYGSISFWEWYLLNTLVRSDNEEDFEKFVSAMGDIEKGKLKKSSFELVENQLSHSYILKNFAFAGLVILEGKKFELTVYPNPKEQEIIDAIIGEGD